jgi:hypothetical protein
VPDWAARIPAAIEKAERLLALREYIFFVDPRASLSATEVALAKALWKVLGGSAWSAPSENIIATLEYFEPLRAFVEKLEAL